MLQKNEEREGIVCSIGMDGEGVVKTNDGIVFVPRVLVGEKIRYKVLRVTSKCSYGKVLEVFTPAEERVRPLCPVFGKCGGCQLQHIRYTEQLELKENKVKVCFDKIANIKVNIEYTEKSPNEYRYRNKLQLPVSDDGNGGFLIGFYAENSHRVIPVSDCMINPLWTKDIIECFSQYFNEFSVKGYREDDNSGDVREITVKEINGNLIITLVALRNNLKSIDCLIDKLKIHFDKRFTLYLNFNDNKTNVVYGDKFIKVFGEKEYYSKMQDISYKIGVQSFMQVNTAVCEKLYSEVVNAVNADKDTVVIDAYSGAGLMTALLAKNAKKAVGIEIIPEAVKIANDLMKENGLTDRVKNYCGKCEEILPRIINGEKESKLSLVLDPPRKGCDINVIRAIQKSNIDRIVYVSCKPSTLARDVGLIIGTLEEEGNEIKKVVEPSLRYNIEYIKPFDMFPNTKHVETLCVLEKV